VTIIPAMLYQRFAAGDNSTSIPAVGTTLSSIRSLAAIATR